MKNILMICFLILGLSSCKTMQITEIKIMQNDSVFIIVDEISEKYNNVIVNKTSNGKYILSYYQKNGYNKVYFDSIISIISAKVKE